MKTKVLMIGWAGADWRVLHSLREMGQLPHFGRLVTGGAVATPGPGSWRTIATGKPRHHSEAPSLWDDFAQAGRHCLVVRWPSLPARTGPLPGSIWVADSFGRRPPAGHREGAPWPLTPGSAEPPEWQESLAELRVHPDEIGLAELRAFVPTVDRGGPRSTDPAITWLAGALADAATTQNVATWLLETEAWDFAAIYYGALGAICRRFLALSLTADPRWEPYREVVAATFTLHDRMLGRLGNLAGPNTVTLVCSARGLPGQPVAVLHGPGVQAGVSVKNADPCDIGPNLRQLAGLAPRAGLTGRVWAEAMPATVPGR
jgi:hypothetical protein